MQLSEAIRLGAMLKPQAFTSDGSQGKSCALRAAGDALGIPELMPNVLDYARFYTRYPYLAIEDAHPVTGMRDARLSLIYFLNDIDHWTREQIADWVATIEPAEVECAKVEALVAESGQ